MRQGRGNLLTLAALDYAGETPAFPPPTWRSQSSPELGRLFLASFGLTCLAMPRWAPPKKWALAKGMECISRMKRSARPWWNRCTSQPLIDADHNSPEAEMHPAAKFQFDRTAREFSQWRAVREEDRSPAPAWWWQPAIDAVVQHEKMGALMCYRLQLPVGSTYAAGAAVLMATLADQTSLPWPDEFPRKIRRE
jgi:hypothetical protein